MGNYILKNKGVLKTKHYLLLANQADYWFNASPNVIKEYKAKYGDGFCLVLYRSRSNDDAYVIPFQRIKKLFSDENLMPGSGDSLRWHGSIKKGHLELRGANESISVSAFYNAFGILYKEQYI